MTPVLCFDIETVPDVAGLRALYADAIHEESRNESVDAGEPDDNAIVDYAIARRRERTGSDFLPLHQHRVVAIACLRRNDKGLNIGCIGSPEDDEQVLVSGFFKQVEHYTPQIVSWNGSGFDLPVMHYRSLVHGIAAPRYWDLGEEDREFKWNNYISRYHSRHLDLMDLLAMYSPRANAPLDELAKICGFPGKLGMDGSKVWESFRDGGVNDIRAYCETDVANTWLMYCRFQLVRGHWERDRYDSELALLSDTLAGVGQDHWTQFLDAWPGRAQSGG